MKTQLSILAVWFSAMLLCGIQAQAAPVAGNWTGVIEFPEVKLRMLFKIAEDGNQLKATLDSLDQGARDIPVDRVELDNSTLRMEVKAVQGGYEGQVNGNGTYITGWWKHGGKEMPLNLERASDSSAFNPPLTGEELAASRQAALRFCGVWNGSVTGQDKTNGIRLKIWRAGGGAARGTLDCLEQSTINMPLKGIRFTDGKLSFQVPGMGAAYAGEFGSDTNLLAGEWRQTGKDYLLEFRKAAPRKP